MREHQRQVQALVVVAAVVGYWFSALVIYTSLFLVCDAIPLLLVLLEVGWRCCHVPHVSFR
jgi:hypothetical protein